MKIQKLRMLTEEEMDNNPLLLKRITDLDISEEIRALFYLIFGTHWERYALVKHFVGKFVRVNEKGEHVLKTRGLMQKHGLTKNPMGPAFYTLLTPHFPGIRDILNELPFININEENKKPPA